MGSNSRVKKKGRAFNKPIPKDFISWDKEVYGIYKMFLKNPPTGRGTGHEWFERTKEYYRERFAALMSQKPKLPKGYKPPKLP